MANIRVGDIGTRLTVTVIDEDGVAVNIATATTKQIKLRKPDQSAGTYTATFTTNGSEGKMYYDTVSGDLDQAGSWSIQGYVEFADGRAFHTGEATFQVKANLV